MESSGEWPKVGTAPLDFALAFPAMLYDGTSPRPRSGTVTVERDRFTLQIEGLQAVVDIRPEHILGESRIRDEVHIEIRSPSENLPSLKLVVKDPAFDGALVKYLAHTDLRAGAAFHRAFCRIPLLGWLAIALVVAPSMYYCLTRGFVALHVLVSVEGEDALGEAVYKHLLGNFKVCDDPAIQVELQAMVDQLAEPDSPYRFRVSVFDTPHVNAVALPGGRIVVFSGLLKESSPEGVLGVLAHEVAHVECRHGLKQILRVMGVMFFMSAVIAGGVEELELAESATELAGVLVVLRHSRSAESEADEIAVRKLHEDRRSVGGLIEFFEQIDKKRGLRGVEEALLWLSSHPLSARRVAALREARAREDFEPTPWRVGREEWNGLVRSCGG